MSPRAACQLERLGFEQVYDYTLGIADWKAAGLPIAAESSDAQLVSDATRPEIPTARPDDLLGAVLDRVIDAGWEEALVLDCDGIVVGRLRTQAWQQDRSRPVSQVMELGPTTVRPNSLLEPLVKRIEERGTALVTVTTPQSVSFYMPKLNGFSLVKHPHISESTAMDAPADGKPADPSPPHEYPAMMGASPRSLEYR
jgi:hypothetical protein